MKAHKIFKIAFLIMVFPTLWSCSSDKLTRAKAEQLIKELHKFPCDEIEGFVIESTSWTSADYSAMDFKKLAAEGILTYTYKPVGFMGGGGAFATLTEEGKKYVTSDKYKDPSNPDGMTINVKIAKLDFGEITGIIEYKESNTAVVNYTYVRKDLTPFGKIKSNFHTGPNNFSHTFTKYDDGWRITK